MAAAEGHERERFAALVEQGPGGPLPGDEQLRREVELVSQLRESRSALAPSADASARMRARVMAAAATMMPAQVDSSDAGSFDAASLGAGSFESASFESASFESASFESASFESEPAEAIDAPALVDEPRPVAAHAAEPDDDDTAEAARSNVVSIGTTRGRHRFPRREASTGSRRGALGVSAAAALMVLAVTGGGALFSRDALPGDTLYGVKQTAESALVGLTPGQGKAQRQLDQAATRIDEVEALNSGQPASGDRGTDVTQALRGFNEQAAAGSRTWLANPGSSGGPGGLARWADEQSVRLAALRSAMPASAQPDADASMRLLDQLSSRAAALNSRKGCDKVTSGESDALGPLPARGACSSPQATTGPQTRQVAPPTAPSRSTTPSDPTNEPELSDPSPSTGSDNTPSAPGLPILPELPGTGSSSGGVAPLPGREPARSNDSVPSVPAESPGVLPIPLLDS